MTSQTIERTIESRGMEPQGAKEAPVVKARSRCGEAIIESGGFSWQAGPAPADGQGRAPSPTSQLLGALAGCAVVSIKDSLAPQLGVRVDAVRATVSCTAGSRGPLTDGAAPDLGEVFVSLDIESPDGQEAVRHLIDAWQARGPVYLALASALKVRVAARVIDWYAGA